VTVCEDDVGHKVSAGCLRGLRHSCSVDAPAFACILAAVKFSELGKQMRKNTPPSRPTSLSWPDWAGLTGFRQLHSSPSAAAAIPAGDYPAGGCHTQFYSTALVPSPMKIPSPAQCCTGRGRCLASEVIGTNVAGGSTGDGCNAGVSLHGDLQP
jgi:hypothetical protein